MEIETIALALAVVLLTFLNAWHHRRLVELEKRLNRIEARDVIRLETMKGDGPWVFPGGFIGRQLRR